MWSCAFRKLHVVVLRRSVCLSLVAYSMAAGGCSEEAVRFGVSNPCHKTAATGVLQACSYF